MDGLFSGPGETRRLPVYLLLDISGSMSGGPIQGVRDGIERFRTALLDVPEAVRTVHIKVITFNDRVTQSQFTPLMTFQPPVIDATGLTAMGGALRALNESAQFGRDLMQNSADHKGDWLPIVFILTDGQPTDLQTEFDAAAAQILQRAHHREMSVFAIAIGNDAQQQTLHQITDNVLRLEQKSQAEIAALFAWLSQGVAGRSRAVSNLAPGQDPPPTNMPPPMPGLVIW